jgi:hypothetical protein
MMTVIYTVERAIFVYFILLYYTREISIFIINLDIDI